MLLLTRCPACDQKIKFRETDRGKRLVCPKCKGGVDTAAVQAATVGAMPATPGRGDAGDGWQMPVWGRDTLVGGGVGFAYGALLGVLFGFAMGLGETLPVDGAADGATATMIGIVVFVIYAVAYTFAGSIIGAAYGLTGSEVAGYVAGGVLAVLIFFVVPGVGWFSIGAPVAFIVLTMRVIDFGQ